MQAKWLAVTIGLTFVRWVLTGLSPGQLSRLAIAESNLTDCEAGDCLLPIRRVFWIERRSKIVNYLLELTHASAISESPSFRRMWLTRLSWAFATVITSPCGTNSPRATTLVEGAALVGGGVSGILLCASKWQTAQKPRMLRMAMQVTHCLRPADTPRNEPHRGWTIANDKIVFG
jgi:hypothetical protein